MFPRISIVLRHLRQEIQRTCSLAELGRDWVPETDEGVGCLDLVSGSWVNVVFIVEFPLV
jgi:hypothetical protein